MADSHNYESQIHLLEANCSDFPILSARADFYEEVQKNCSEELSQDVTPPDAISIELMKAWGTDAVRAFIGKLTK